MSRPFKIDLNDFKHIRTVYKYPNNSTYMNKLVSKSLFSVLLTGSIINILSHIMKNSLYLIKVITDNHFAITIDNTVNS